MSYQVPEDYPSLPSNTSIPHALIGDDLKIFAGARCNTRYVQAASGQNVGAGSNILFNMPAEPYGYIKPNSMVLRGTVTVTQTNAANAYWMFAGQPDPICALTTIQFGGANALTTGQAYNHYTSPSYPVVNNYAGSANSGVGTYTGGATSLINRVSVTLPGGASMTYNQHHHWRNAVTPHTLSKIYVEQELKELECGQVNVNVTASTANTTRSFSCPLDIPLFNSDCAFPMLLTSGGMTIEFTTNSVNEAFAAGTNPVSSYSLSGLALVYEVIIVTPDFKQALLHSKKDKPYMIHVNDRMHLGPVVSNSSQRFNLGVSLSSMKCVLFTEMLQSQLSATTATVNTVVVPNDKFYGGSQITQYNVYRDGLQITPNYLTSEDIWYSELNRAIGRINDSNTTSCMYAVYPADASSERTTYTRSQLLFGATMQTIDDWAFAAQGVPVDQLSIEITKQVLTAASNGSSIGYIGVPQTNTAGVIPYANLYLWACFDSVVVIMPDGMCTIRR